MDKVSGSYTENIAVMKALFERDKTAVFRSFSPRDSNIEMCIVFCDGMVNNDRINESIIKPVTLWTPPKDSEITLELVQNRVIQINEIKRSDSFSEIEYAMVYGDTILFCQGCREALILNTKGFSMRSIAEPQGETVIKGPREGFSEGILLNISMLRRKIRSSALKFEYLQLGSESKTTCCLCYIDGVVDKKVLKDVKKRVNEVKIDGVLGSNYISEMIREHKWSPFKTIGSTERPDVVASKLLEGRVALVVDGTPVVLTMPYVFIEQFQAAEDYYVGFHFATIARIMRILGFLLAISVAPIYIALTAHHPEMIPTGLLMAIVHSRQGVPFPMFAECIALLIVFDILREAATRTPPNVGQALSIVGGLVLGSAAVEAQFVSAAVVIIMALSGITGLIIPKLNAAIIALRFSYILLAAVGGLYGYVLGLALLALHLSGISSFGVPFLTGSVFSQLGSHEDGILRVPFSLMKKSGRFVAREKR